jgi:hypothetical protein
MDDKTFLIRCAPILTALRIKFVKINRNIKNTKPRESEQSTELRLAHMKDNERMHTIWHVSVPNYFQMKSMNMIWTWWRIVIRLRNSFDSNKLEHGEGMRLICGNRNKRTDLIQWRIPLPNIYGMKSTRVIARSKALWTKNLNGLEIADSRSGQNVESISDSINP